MISRTWRGVAKAEEADHYVRHLQTDTFSQLARIPGFLSGSILRRPIAGGVEFLIVTNWESMEAIRAFAGDPGDMAVVPPAVQAMMVDYDTKVAHYEVVDAYRPAGGDGAGAAVSDRALEGLTPLAIARAAEQRYGRCRQA